MAWRFGVLWSFDKVGPHMIPFQCSELREKTRESSITASTFSRECVQIILHGSFLIDNHHYLQPNRWLNIAMSLVAEFLVYRPHEEIQQRGASDWEDGHELVHEIMKSLRVEETSC